MTGKDEKKLSESMESKRKRNLPESNLTDQLRMMMVSVNGNTDPNYINSFINNMPALDSKILRKTYQELIPNVDMSQEFACSNCSFEGEVDVPFGASFFWPK